MQLEEKYLLPGTDTYLGNAAHISNYISLVSIAKKTDLILHICVPSCEPMFGAISSQRMNPTRSDLRTQIDIDWYYLGNLLQAEFKKCCTCLPHFSFGWQRC